MKHHHCRNCGASTTNRYICDRCWNSNDWTEDHTLLIAGAGCFIVGGLFTVVVWGSPYPTLTVLPGVLLVMGSVLMLLGLALRLS